MRVGIIDVGSNTVRLLVASAAGNRLAPVLERRAFLGLGEEVENYGWISDVKLRETALCVREQAAEARAAGAHHVEVMVTAPGRQSANAPELIAALAAAARTSVRVLGPEEEGRLSYFGVLAGLEELPESIAVCDLGGGSTELVVGTPAGPAWERSIDLGAVRLTHRLDLDDPPGKDVLPAAREEAHGMMNGLLPPFAKAAYVTGGTARALRKLAGRKLGKRELERAEALLCKRSSAEIAERFEINPLRARTLLAGCLILAEAHARLAIPLEVAKTGLREGARWKCCSRGRSRTPPTRDAAGRTDEEAELYETRARRPWSAQGRNGPAPPRAVIGSVHDRTPLSTRRGGWKGGGEQRNPRLLSASHGGAGVRTDRGGATPNA